MFCFAGLVNMSEYYKGKDIVLFHINYKTSADETKHLYHEVFQVLTHGNNVLTLVIIPIKLVQCEFPEIVLLYVAYITVMISPSVRNFKKCLGNCRRQKSRV